MALLNKDPTPSIHILSILSTHTMDSIHATHLPTIVEGQPEDPPTLVTAPHQTRMTRRAFGHNPSCDNQSSSVVLRDDSKLGFVFSGKEEGAFRCAGHVGRLTAAQGQRSSMSSMEDQVKRQTVFGIRLLVGQAFKQDCSPASLCL
ncbi:hypothetical protein LDENG_00276040 [Lucifuga dentata]|nr:hypothetical protein LDENG_00276040 [Lucifuga dentata]